MRRNRVRLGRLILLLLISATVFAQNEKWKPGEYRGLVTGKATKAEMQRVFGIPPAPGSIELASIFDPKLYEQYLYAGQENGRVDLKFTVRKRDGVIDAISEHFTISMPRTPAYKKFGRDWTSHFYLPAKCAARNGHAPLYRVGSEGGMELIEYPSKGIVLWPDSVGYDIYAAVYLSRAPGLPAPPACVKASRRTNNKLPR